MGYDQHQQSSSSGAVVAIVVVVMLVAILGILAVAGAGFFMVRTSSMQSRAVPIESRMAAEVQRAKAEEQRAVAHVRIKDGMVQVQRSSVRTTPAPRLNFEVTLDREGNASIDGKGIGLDELRAQLAKLKDETGNSFSVHINVDSECLFKHVVSVMDVCEEVGDIDFRVASSSGADSSPDEDDTAN